MTRYIPSAVICGGAAVDVGEGCNTDKDEGTDVEIGDEGCVDTVVVVNMAIVRDCVAVSAIELVGELCLL